VGRSKSLRAAIAVVALWALHDFVVPPRYAIDARAAVFAIDAYRARVSPRISSFVQCRFQPTCSQYSRASILKHGFLFGGGKTLIRLVRCGPWTPRGTIDLP
jgi:putative membrane protein insertion efficiency factor